MKASTVFFITFRYTMAVNIQMQSLGLYTTYIFYKVSLANVSSLHSLYLIFNVVHTNTAMQALN